MAASTQRNPFVRGSRTRNSALNLISSSGASVALLLVGLFSTPWLFRMLGDERYGAFRALTDLFQYVTLIELGLSGSIMGCLAPALGRGDDEEIRRTLAESFRAYLRVTAAMASAALLLAVLVPGLIETRAVSNVELRAAGLIFVLPVLLTPVMTLRVLVESRQQGYLVTTFITAQLLLTTVLLILAAWAGWGLPGQALATAAAQLPVAILFFGYGMRLYPRFWRAPKDANVRRKIWSLNWPTFTFNMSSRLALLSDNIVIAWWLGAAAVAPFYLTQRLAQIAQNQLQGIGNATWAGLVELHVTEQTDTFRKRMLELTSIVSGTGMAVLGPIAAWNPYFLKLWLGEQGYAGGFVNWMAVFNIWLWALFSLWGWPISGAGHVRSLAPYTVVFMLTNIVFSVACTVRLGLAGPLLGTAAGFLLVNSWVFPMLLRRHFGIPPGRLWRAVLRQAWWGFPYAALCARAAGYLAPETWIGVGLQMGLAGFGGLALWWLLGMGAERETLSPHLRAVMSRFR